MSHPIFLNAEQVKSVLSWPMINEAVEKAIISIVENKADTNGPTAYQPHRSLTQCGDRSKILLTMPAFVGNYDLTIKNKDSTTSVKKFNTLACKMVTSFRGNDKREKPLPNILANILVFSTETGELECVMDATQITGWRTASASIVATKYLYFERCDKCATDSINVGIIGCGVQGQSHALGMCATFNVSNIYLWNRTKSKAENLKKILVEQFPRINVIVTDSPDAAVENADVICVGTYSPTALINFSMLKKPNVHINTVGAGEVHFGEVAQDIYDKAKVYVDSWESARIELKDLKATIVAEVGEVILNKSYPAKEGITIFQSMGMAVEDATVAQAVYENFQGNMECIVEIKPLQ